MASIATRRYIACSSDFCAEHECGIYHIVRVLGLPQKLTKQNAGVKKLMVTRFDEQTFFFDTREDYSLLTFDAFGRLLGIGEDVWRDEELNPQPKELSAAWSDSHFAIIVAKPYQSFLSDLFEAFKRRDVMIGFTEALGAQNPGLTIMIASRFPKDTRRVLRMNDLRYLRLLDAVAETGIRDILKATNKRYYALTPKWANEDESEILFWLNPQDQQNNNFGWFTLQDLLDWSQDKGPIPKESKN